MDENPQPNPEDGGEQKPDTELHTIFDLDRSRETGRVVDQFERAIQDVEAAQEDVKQIAASAKQSGFSQHEVAAMKRVARLRLKDKGPETKKQLAALERVSRAANFDLFD